MKFITVVLLILFSWNTYSQSGFYTWLFKTKSELLSSMGRPVSIYKERGENVYMYVNGTTTSHYMTMDDRIIITVLNLATFNTRKAAEDAMTYLVHLCRSDGFSINKINSGKYTAKSRLYKCKITIAIENKKNKYSLFEMAQALPD